MGGVNAKFLFQRTLRSQGKERKLKWVFFLCLEKHNECLFDQTWAILFKRSIKGHLKETKVKKSASLEIEIGYDHAWNKEKVVSCNEDY